MRKVAINHSDSFALFRAISTSKWEPIKSLLAWKESVIQEQFESFLTNSHELFPITPFSSFSDKEKEALLHCYESPTNGLKKVKKIVKEVCKSPCPYCGIDGTREFDHYLPKAEFPEFSALDLNLIACCGECNKKKWDRWKDPSSRLFLNCYFDQIPEEQVLFVRFSFSSSNGEIESEFYLERPSSDIDDTLWCILEKHVSNLRLSGRYNEEFSVPISELKSFIGVISRNENKPLTTEDISLLAENEAQRYEMYGKNYWKAVVYHWIAWDQRVLEYLLI